MIVLKMILVRSHLHIYCLRVAKFINLTINFFLLRQPSLIVETFYFNCRNIIFLIDMSDASKETDFKPDRFNCVTNLLEVSGTRNSLLSE